MKKEIMIGDASVPFKVSGAIGRLYRLYFRRDFLADFMRLKKTMISDDNEVIGENIDMETFENLAWAMAKHADPSIPEIEDWLSQFEYNEFTQALKEIFMLLADGMRSTVESKNKLARETMTK